MTIVQAANPLTQLDNEFIQAIQAENPFDRSLFVKQQDIWERDFVDVPSLNAAASDLVLKAVQLIQAGKRKSIGITLTADRGLGKSHIIGRICHSLRMGEQAFFIYMGEYNNLAHIKEEFLQEVAYSLKHTMRAGYMQWQELATAMANRAMQKHYAPRHLVDDLLPKQEQFAKEKDSSIRPTINHLRKQFLTASPHLANPYLVQAIFWTLSKPHAPAAINWLAGNEITPIEAQMMGLPIASSEAPGFNAFRQAQQILDILGEFAPAVICFDELDSLGQTNDIAAKPRAVASLAKDILNSLKRGVVLTTIYPQTWTEHIQTMPQAEGIADRIGEKVISLNPLNPEGVTALVTKWLEEFYFEKRYTPETPIYPFTLEEMQIVGENGPTFRTALQDCRQLFGEKINITPQGHPVQVAYETELKTIEIEIEQLIEDSSKIAKALRLGLRSAIGQSIHAIEVRDVQDIEARTADQGYIDFRIVAKEGGRIAKIGVSVLQNTGGTGVGACLRRLIDYDTFDLTRGCLVRSKPISPSATQAQQLVQELITEKKGEWVWLRPEHIMPLLAIDAVYDRCTDYELTEAQVVDFINHQNLAQDNPLIQEILSKPSGKIPKDISYEELISLREAEETDASALDIAPSFGDKLRWIYDITRLADRSIELETGTKSNYQAGTDFENITRTSLEFLGFVANQEHCGGAGGLDLACSAPFPLVAECKAGHSIPNNAVEELIRLGVTHLGKDGFEASTKLVIGSGKPTEHLLTAAGPWNVSILSARALQKLVEAKALYPGIFSLDRLRDYLIAGVVDERIEAFIQEQVLSQLNIHAEVMQLAAKSITEKATETATAEELLQIFRHQHPERLSLGDNEFHDILIELSSPLTGYLKREKSTQKWADRFYFLRELQVN
jgi:hypothetical protein